MSKSKPVLKGKTSIAIALLVTATGLPACGGSDSNSGNGGVVWGSGTFGLVNGSQDAARFDNPVNVEIASDGTVYVADFNNNAIRVIETDGDVRTLTTTANVVAPATAFQRPFGMTITPNGTLYVQTDRDGTGTSGPEEGTIWRINRTTGAATMIQDDLGRPRGLQALTDNLIAMSDPAHHVITIFNVALADEGAPIAGAVDQAGFVDNANGATARFDGPYGLDLVGDGTTGSLIVADYNNHRIRVVSLQGSNAVGTLAGTGAEGNNNGIVTAATFKNPQDIAIDETGGGDPIVYVAEAGDDALAANRNPRIRRISGTGVTATVANQAGNGTSGFAEGNGTLASFYGLEGIALEADGDTLWIADGNRGEDSTTSPYHRVRFITVP
jgi:sugar lactone lactonase YvrE